MTNMKTPKKSVEEISTEILKGVPAIEMVVDIGDGERDMVDIREELEGRIETALQAERQKRDEMVEQAHMAGYYSCCKRDSSYSEARNYRESLTQPNNSTQHEHK